MDDLKAILFDTFGSLVDWRSSVITDLSAWGAARGHDIDWASFADAWRGAYKPSMDRVRRGEQGWTLLDDLHRQSLDALLTRHGITVLDDAERTHLAFVWRRLHPWPDSVAGLTRLKQRFIIGPLSNGNLALLVNLAKFAALPFDVIFGSDMQHHFKPDPEVYLGACRMLGLQPHQVMMAAAHNYDLEAARALGLKTGFFPRPTEYGPNQTRDLRAESDWDIVATSVIDLAQQLGA